MGRLEYCFLLIIGSWICNFPAEAADDERQVYIVYTGSLPDTINSVEELQKQHVEMLEGVVDSSFSTDAALVTSYKRSFNGFAARLTEQEKLKLADHNSVVSIFPSRTLWPQTTRSWDYMGFHVNTLRSSQNKADDDDLIIGVIDSGIWPESESFSDEGFSPIPKKWKGKCEGGSNFTCNKKLIGARYYNHNFFDSDDSARDTIGHGTHTASTAAGNLVKDRSFYGIAGGTAQGGLPSARIAVYKVCQEGCSESAILSAFDDAIADGVDIITISVGSARANDIKVDGIAIGSLHATLKGILTVQTAGNNGFEPGTVNSVAPWLLTVAASTMDRGIVTKIKLGNGRTILGKALNPFKLNGTDFPLVYGKGVTEKCSETSAKMCSAGCLDRNQVKGKIILCNGKEAPNEAFRAGAIGTIVKARDAYDVSFNYPLPTSALISKDFESVEAYVNSDKDAKALILTSEAIKNIDAPKVATFSSKGPNPIIPSILKPDITAPGVEILAAFSPVAPVTTSGEDKRSVKYQILSGTSMACPHVAGAAAYVKSVHPDWSPSAIKSALMTTAWPMDHKHGDEFGYGAGHLSPINATNPGLVYETDRNDYIKLLCKLKYSDRTIGALFNDKSIKCSSTKLSEKTTEDPFNYPSMTIRVEDNAPLSARFTRTVTNVGSGESTYRAKIDAAAGVVITVEPQTLSFSKPNEKKSFTINVKAKEVKSMMSSALLWADGVHIVRSPIVVYRTGLTSIGSN